MFTRPQTLKGARDPEIVGDKETMLGLVNNVMHVSQIGEPHQGVSY